MSVEVIVLPQGGDEPVITTDRPWHESRLTKIDYARWAELANEIARRAAAGGQFRVNVFLNFKGDHLVGRYDFDFVEKLVELARDHAWGGRIYLTVDRGIFKDPDDIRSSIPSIAYWLETAHRGRAADVILSSVSRMNPNRPPPQLLQRYGDESVEKSGRLSDLMWPGTWSCWAVPGSAIARFDGDESGPAARANGKNFLIAVDRKSSFKDEERGEIKKFIRKNRGGSFALAVVGIAASGFSADLQSLAAELSLRVVEVRGWLELRYFLLRLNRLCAPQSALSTEMIQAVAPHAETLFRGPYRDAPGLLITNCFNQQQDPALCLEAARDVGRLLRAITPHSTYTVHPALRAGQLSELFGAAGELTAWWFMGHGGGDAGLQDVDARVLSPREWLEKLSGCARRLPLVFFSSCRSAETAKAFARAGAGVAIGFENPTLPAPCRILAMEVINAALASRGDRGEILSAFSAGCRQLQVRGLDYIKPRAFYAAG
ncbi:MAG TPA: hypothetical protein VIP46_14925 [Pyrinomonadaceae bacterium]